MGCQTTQSANKDTKPADIEPIITEEKKPINPYAKKEIPEDLQIMTSKPIICGRVDKVLGRVKKVYGEEPVLLGQGTTEKEKTGKPIIPSNKHKPTVAKPILYPKLIPKNKTTNVCIVIGTG